MWFKVKQYFGQPRRAKHHRKKPGARSQKTLRKTLNKPTYSGHLTHLTNVYHGPGTITKYVGWANPLEFQEENSSFIGMQINTLSSLRGQASSTSKPLRTPVIHSSKLLILPVNESDSKKFLPKRSTVSQNKNKKQN